MRRFNFCFLYKFPNISVFSLEESGVRSQEGIKKKEEGRGRTRVEGESFFYN